MRPSYAVLVGTRWSRTLRAAACVGTMLLAPVGGCKRAQPPPNVTGTFRTSEMTFTSNNGTGSGPVRPQAFHNLVVQLVLSDEQATSTQVVARIDTGAVGARSTVCSGRATRVDRADGSTYTVTSPRCSLAGSDWTPSTDWGARNCAITAGGFGFTYDAASRSIRVTGPMLRAVYVSGQGDSLHPPCGRAISAELPVGAEFRHAS